LIAAGTGALLWAVLAAEASVRRRTVVGLVAFLALEAAVFVRYTDVVVLGCAVIAVVAIRRLRIVELPRATLGWWLGSSVVSVMALVLFNDFVYGGPLTSGYAPGEVKFSLGAVLPNLRYMPKRLIEAMPLLVLGLVALMWIAGRWIRLRRTRAGTAAIVRRDMAVALALAESWLGMWSLYAVYTWTAYPSMSTLQTSRFYVPALGAMSLLGAWTVVWVARRASLAAVTSVVVVGVLFGLGL
jgi:hypothetical protein